MRIAELEIKEIELQPQDKNHDEVTADVTVTSKGLSLTVLRSGSYHHHIDLEVEPNGIVTLKIRRHGDSEGKKSQTIGLFDSTWEDGNQT